VEWVSEVICRVPCLELGVLLDLEEMGGEHWDKVPKADLLKAGMTLRARLCFV
jgi:hypothetical protein